MAGRGGGGNHESIPVAGRGRAGPWAPESRVLRRPHTTFRPMQGGEIGPQADFRGLPGGEMGPDPNLYQFIPTEQALAYNSFPAMDNNPGFVRNIDPRVSEIALNSTLSADAAEFVPRAQLSTPSYPVYATTPVHPPAYRPQNCYRGGYSQGRLYQPRNDRYGSQPYGVQDPSQLAISRLQEVMNQLTLSPGMFGSLVTPLAESLKAWLSDPDITKAAVNVLFEQAVNEANFRYTGARLSNALSQKCSSGGESPFRNALLVRCNQEFEQRKTLVNCDPSRLRGFTHFLAELYLQLEIRHGDLTERVSMLGQALLNLLDLILSQNDKDSIKCYTQILKLVGQSLEEDNPATMAELIGRTREMLTDAQLDPSLRNMLNSVVSLRDSAWGRQQNQQQLTPPAEQQQQQLQHNGTAEPVFYGPDGTQLTSEERQFLMKHFESSEDYGGDGSEFMEGWSLGNDDVDEMDDEAHAAYEEFLKMMQKC